MSTLFGPPNSCLCRRGRLDRCSSSVSRSFVFGPDCLLFRQSVLGVHRSLADLCHRVEQQPVECRNRSHSGMVPESGVAQRCALLALLCGSWCARHVSCLNVINMVDVPMLRTAEE